MQSYLLTRTRVNKHKKMTKGEEPHHVIYGVQDKGIKIITTFETDF